MPRGKRISTPSENCFAGLSLEILSQQATIQTNMQPLGDRGVGLIDYGEAYAAGLDVEPQQAMREASSMQT
jgi:hypothetical protein